MSNATPQAKRAIDALKASGLSRSQFRVRTERRTIPAAHGGGYELGNAEVVIFASAETVATNVPAMLANGLDVSITKGSRADGRAFYTVDAEPIENRASYDATPEATLSVFDLTTPDPRYAADTICSRYTNDARAWAVYGELMRSITTADKEARAAERAERARVFREQLEASRAARAEANA